MAEKTSNAKDKKEVVEKKTDTEETDTSKKIDSQSNSNEKKKENEEGIKIPEALPKKKITSKKETSKKVVTKLDSKTNVPPKEKTDLKENVISKAIKSKSVWTGNPMLKPIIEKVTINMSEGKSGAPLQQAVAILKKLTDQEPSKRAAKKTVREFGIRKGESIACLVTIREEKAEEFLRKAFYAIENKLSKYNFDRQGNFSFGIKEHIDLPGVKYAPELGIHGMDVSVSLGRRGYRVKRRHRVRSKIGKSHILTPEEAILFIKDEFDVEIT